MSTSDVLYRIAIARGDLMDADRQLGYAFARAAISVHHLRNALEECGLPEEDLDVLPDSTTEHQT